MDVKAFPKLDAWLQRCYARPGVQKGVRVPAADSMIVKGMEDDSQRVKNLQDAQQIMQVRGRALPRVPILHALSCVLHGASSCISVNMGRWPAVAASWCSRGGLVGLVPRRS